MEIEGIFVKIGTLMGDFDAAMATIQPKVQVVLQRVEDLHERAAASVQSTWKMKSGETFTVENLSKIRAEMQRLEKQATSTRMQIGRILTGGDWSGKGNAAETKAMLKSLRSELKSVEAALAEAGVAAKQTFEYKLISSLDKAGAKLREFGGWLNKHVTVPLTAAAVGIAAMAVKVTDYASELEVLAAKTGLSVQALQELKFIAEETGLNFSTVTTAISMMQQKLTGAEEDAGNAAKSLTKLGVSVYDANGGLRPMAEMIPEIIGKLQGLGNATERNMLAAQIFGQGWRELAPLLAMGGTEFDRLKAKAHELGLVMSDEQIKALVELGNEIDRLKMQFAQLARDLITQLKPIFESQIIPLFRDRFIPAIRSLIEWFGRLSPGTQDLIIKLLAISAAAGPLLTVLGSFLGVLGGIVSAAISARAALIMTSVLQALSNGALVATGSVLKLTSALRALAAIGVIVITVKIGWEIGEWFNKLLHGETIGDVYDDTLKTNARSRDVVKGVQEMRQQMLARKQPSYESIAAEWGWYDAYAHRHGKELTDAQEVKLRDEYRRRMAEFVRTTVKPAKGGGTQGTGTAPPPVADLAGPLEKQSYDLTMASLRAEAAGDKASAEWLKINSSYYKKLAENQRQQDADEKGEFDKLAADAMALQEYRTDKATFIAGKTADGRKNAIETLINGTQASNEAALAQLDRARAEAASAGDQMRAKAWEIQQQFTRSWIEATKLSSETGDFAYSEDVRANKLAAAGAERNTAMTQLRKEAALNQLGDWKDVTALAVESRRMDLEAGSYELGAALAKVDGEFVDRAAEIQTAIIEGKPAGYVDTLRNVINKQWDAARAKAREDVTRRQSQAALKADVKDQDEQGKGYDKLIKLAQGYHERLMGLVYGENAVKLAKLQDWRDNEASAIEESIKDNTLRAEALRLLDADYVLRRNEVTSANDEEQRKWMDGIRQRMAAMVGFASAEGAWQARSIGAMRMALAGPQGFSPAVPPNVAMQSGRELDAVRGLLQNALQAQQDISRNTDRLNRLLEEY